MVSEGSLTLFPGLPHLTLSGIIHNDTWKPKSEEWGRPGDAATGSSQLLA